MKIGDCKNIFLTAPVGEVEIKEAAWSCDQNKSPGPDGFSFGFYGENWEIVKAENFRILQEFHSHGKIVKGMNPSFIVRIPKKETRTSLNDFRPISLMDSLYKIIAKVFANRLSKILDPIAALNGNIDGAKKKRRRWVVFKVDFTKAYDSVS